MLCNIIKFDQRFIDLDLDVIGGIHYEPRRDGTCIRMDTFMCSQTIPRFKDFTGFTGAKCEFLVVPEMIADVLPDVVVVGEVWAEEQNVNEWWTWWIDRRVAEMVIMDFYVRLNYLKVLDKQIKLKKDIERLKRK